MFSIDPRNLGTSFLRLATVVLCIASMGLHGAGESQAGRGRGAGPTVVSPEVGADRTITFRYLAPNAKDVTVNGELEGKPHPMTRDANGVWSTTVGPLPPDIYTYAFNVDGVIALDPRNTNTKMGYSFFGPVSVVEVPGDGPQFYDVKPVPHGVVRIQPYASRSLGVNRTMWVYTPPDYEKGRQYPVFYLFHGLGDIESGWTLIGRANNILDNLIAEGKARPMIVVMPLGHPIQSFYAGPAKSSPAAAGADVVMPPSGGAFSPFARDLLEDVIPLVEKTYKVSTGSDDRAIGGLSMGGGQTINIAFNRPGLARYVVIMSPAVPQNLEQDYGNFFKDPAATNRQLKLLWIAVGKDDGLVGNATKMLDETLTRTGIKHTYLVTEGRHEWTVWRHYLHDVAPLLFK